MPSPSQQSEDCSRGVDDVGYSTSPGTPSREKPSSQLLTRLASLTSLLSDDDDDDVSLDSEQQGNKKASRQSQVVAPGSQKRDVVCQRCQMVIEAGDSYLAAMNYHWHSSCFKCAVRVFCPSFSFFDANSFLHIHS